MAEFPFKPGKFLTGLYTLKKLTMNLISTDIIWLSWSKFPFNFAKHRVYEKAVFVLQLPCKFFSHPIVPFFFLTHINLLEMLL